MGVMCGTGQCAHPAQAHHGRRIKGLRLCGACVSSRVGMTLAYKSPARCVGMYCNENGKLKYLKFEKDHPSKDLIVQFMSKTRLSEL